MRKTLLSLLFLVFACIAAHAAEISGIWKAQFDTPMGTEKYSFELKADGSVLTGKAINEHGTSVLKDGKIDGNTLSFVEPVSMNGMDMAITYTGTIDGDTIHFSRKVGDFGQDTFNAIREK